MKGRRREGCGVVVWLIAALASAEVIVGLPAHAAAGASAGEQRIVVPLALPPVGQADDCAGVTMTGDAPNSIWVVMERRGDAVTVSLSGAMAISTGMGSELRFKGTVQTDKMTVASLTHGRLCFKRTDEGWVYLCGRGQVKYPDGTVSELGDRRTLESCLDLLSSPDSILREGGARDLGRLTTADEAQRVMPRLVPLLQDSMPSVRRGAAEGLGLIGRQECMTALRAAAAAEQEELTKEYIAEALFLCGGNVLIGEPNAPELSASEAAKLYLKGGTGWANDMLAQRIQARGGAATKALIVRLDSAEADVRLAAVRLLGAANCVEAREALTKLSTGDPDEKVKAAAKEAADKLPK